MEAGLVHALRGRGRTRLLESGVGSDHGLLSHAANRGNGHGFMQFEAGRAEDSLEVAGGTARR